MKTPWLIHTGPIVVPTDAREELMQFSSPLAPGYVERIWQQRYPDGDPLIGYLPRLSKKGTFPWKLKSGVSTPTLVSVR